MESKMAVEYISPEELTPSEHNARIHPPEQIEALVESIRVYGFLVPVLVDEENRIIKGHGCVEAAKAAGLEKIPIVRNEGLTEAQKRGFMLADNRLAEMSHNDMEAVVKELQALREMDFDTDLTGFSYEELAGDDLSGLAGLFEDAPPKQKEPKKVVCPHCGQEFEL